MTTEKIAGVEVIQDITVYCKNYNCVHHHNTELKCSKQNGFITIISSGCSDFTQKECLTCVYDKKGNAICGSCYESNNNGFSEWSPRP